MKRKYNKIFDDLVFELKLDGKPDSYIAKAFKISRDSFYSWLKKYESFKKSYDEGRNAITEIKRSLRKRAIGYTYKEEQAFISHGKIKKEKVEKHMAGDVRSAQYFLKRTNFDVEWEFKRHMAKLDYEHKVWLDKQKLELEKEKLNFINNNNGLMPPVVIVDGKDDYLRWREEQALQIE